ncbi:hypothetical protein KTD19_28515 [Burkholderia multivorans]|nr:MULTISPECIES: hypothetical protein [Burkholderia cepacia complex]MBJ9625255.1 hypothetical protein [Burkholderia multivorans]MBU9212350.1 hypothetical protein [Burkholderia multivorans]MBU9236321.1 hypothetical protein [Burkholderia multivorans]MBU9336830.1 hypothetical protein [Burkholderia multivorans]MBU9444516.1 hypothetical protein [Burkholderia multivorans]
MYWRQIEGRVGIGREGPDTASRRNRRTMKYRAGIAGIVSLNAYTEHIK